MTHKIKLIALFSLVLIISATNLLRERKFDDIGTFIFLFSIAVVLSLIMLYFLSKESFNIWLNFTVIYLPISVILVAIAPSYNNCFFTGFCFQPDKESLTWLLSVLYFIISFVLIVRAHRRLKRKAKETPFPTGGQKPTT